MSTTSQTGRNGRHNLVTIIAGELIWIETRGANPPDVLVPSEYAPVFAVDLPLAQHRMRVVAAPFALEDRVSQPLSELHVALGAEVAPKRFLVGVTENARMAEWRACLAASRVTPRRIIPDASLLVAPDSEAAWTVKMDGRRVLVRTRGQEAFATSAYLFEAMWVAAGRPALQQVGEGDVPVAAHVSAHADRSPAVLLDLDPGAGRNTGRSYEVPLMIAAGVIVAAALTHTAILAFDVGAINEGVRQRRAEASRLLASISPLARPGQDPAASLEAMLPDRSRALGGSQFLPLLSRVSASLQPVSAGMAVQALSYDEADGALLLKIEVADLPALDRIVQSLTDAGLSAQSGGATVEGGGAESSITIRDGPGLPTVGGVQ